jgi:putative NADH-flavin reductase
LFLRSAYFQQIEEDVQKYAKSITELKLAISSFQTKDMAELIKFHKSVESILEHLTDESQVTMIGGASSFKGLCEFVILKCAI